MNKFLALILLTLGVMVSSSAVVLANPGPVLAPTPAPEAVVSYSALESETPIEAVTMNEFTVRAKKPTLGRKEKKTRPVICRSREMEQGMVGERVLVCDTF